MRCYKMDLKRVVEGADPYCLVSLKSLQIDFRRKSAPFACRQSYGLWGVQAGRLYCKDSDETMYYKCLE